MKIIEGELFDGVEIGSAFLPRNKYFVNHDSPSSLLQLTDNSIRYLVGVKFSRHECGDASGARELVDYRRVTVLTMGGPWRQKIWNDLGNSITICLSDPGDFIAWERNFHHEWYCVGDADMLTVNFGAPSAGHGLTFGS